MKVYVIAPKNPESFWTFDRILPSLKKRCVFPNLALPTVAGLTPPSHEIVLCDENVEPIDFDTDADVVGITGFVVHKRRMFEIAAAFRRRGKFVVAGGPFATLCPEELRGKVDVLFVGEAEYTLSWEHGRTPRHEPVSEEFQTSTPVASPVVESVSPERR